MLIRKSKDSTNDASAMIAARFARRSSGFTVLELLLVVAVGIILAGVAIPMMSSAMNNMHVNSVVDAITGAVSKTRYQSIMTSQPYTLAITAPSNTYVVTNVTTGTASATVPLPNQTVAINSGTAATYTFTFCPNGTVWGAGGGCPGIVLPPALSVSSQGRQVNLSISSVGNVTTTSIH
jgi:Tfp pilus assembly protein PilE